MKRGIIGLVAGVILLLPVAIAQPTSQSAPSNDIDWEVWGALIAGLTGALTSAYVAISTRRSEDRSNTLTLRAQLMDSEVESIVKLRQEAEERIRKMMDSYEAEIKVLKATVEELREELGELKVEAGSLMHEIDRYREEIADYEEKERDLQLEVSNLRLALMKLQNNNQQ